MRRSRVMVVRFYPMWYCSFCYRGFREDRTDIGREKGIMYVYCPNCGSGLGCRMDEPEDNVSVGLWSPSEVS